MILIKEVDKLKKYLLAIILISVVIIASGCINKGNQTANNTSNSTKTYNGDEFNFNYPANWQQISNEAPNSVVAFGDPNSTDSSGNTQINVVIQKVAKPSNMTLQEYYNTTYTQFASENIGYKPVSNGTIEINGKSALENVYIINSGVQKEQRAIWIQNNNVIYTILCSAPVSNYNSQQSNFNMIINSFKII